MRQAKLEDFFRGWFIGDFEPAMFRTKDFEVGVLSHAKDEYWAAHYHRIAIEYNVLLSGKMMIELEDGTIKYINPGDVFAFERNEISKPSFLEDCKVLVIKVPSVIGDKYNVE